MKKQFKAYFWKFYGKKGLYPKTLPNLTSSEFNNALGIRLKNKNIAFDGDTFDRELVRDIILTKRQK